MYAHYGLTPLRQRMIEDMNARKLSEGTQRNHKRFAARDFFQLTSDAQRSRIPVRKFGSA